MTRESVLQQHPVKPPPSRLPGLTNRFSQTTSRSSVVPFPFSRREVGLQLRALSWPPPQAGEPTLRNPMRFSTDWEAWRVLCSLILAVNSWSNKYSFCLKLKRRKYGWKQVVGTPSVLQQLQSSGVWLWSWAHLLQSDCSWLTHHPSPPHRWVGQGHQLP